MPTEVQRMTVNEACQNFVEKQLAAGETAQFTTIDAKPLDGGDPPQAAPSRWHVTGRFVVKKDIGWPVLRKVINVGALMSIVEGSVTSSG
jgi:hypothetical protein